MFLKTIFYDSFWLKLLSQSPPVSPARTRTMLSALFAGQQPSETFCKSPIRPLAKTPRQKVRGSSAPRECGIAPRSRGGARVAQCKNRGTLKSVRATSGASRPLASTASTPDAKVTRQQKASSKQCAGKRAASRGARADAKRARAEIAAGAEGACQETDEEHWQRHSCQPGAHLCCRCNFIKRNMEIKRDLP